MEEMKKLNLMFEQYRSVVYQHYGFDKISEPLKYFNTTNDEKI
jgi:hypothetical protein